MVNKVCYTVSTMKIITMAIGLMAMSLAACGGSGSAHALPALPTAGTSNAVAGTTGTEPAVGTYTFTFTLPTPLPTGTP